MSQKKKLKSNEILGINQGLSWLSQNEIKDLGIELSWDVVSMTNKLKPIIQDITDLGEKINREFYERTDEGFRLVKGLEDKAIEAEKGLSSMEFEIDLPKIPFEKIKELKGITPKHILQLQPVLTR